MNPATTNSTQLNKDTGAGIFKPLHLLDIKAKLTMLFIVMILGISCSPTLRIPAGLNYDETVNRQFWSADWSMDDQYIAVGGVDSILRIYYAHDLTIYKEIPINSWIHSVKWNPSHNLLAVATLDKSVKFIEPQSGNIITLNLPGGSRAIGWNYNGQLFAVGDLDGQISIWDRKGNLQSAKPRNYPEDVVGRSYLALDWHPSKNILVAGNFQLTVFDSSGIEIRSMEHRNKAAIILSLDWHPSGDFFVVGDYGHNWEGENVPSLLHYWSESGEYIKAVTGSAAPYRNIDWNASGSALASASDVLRIRNREGILKHQGRSDSTNYLWGVSWNQRGNRIVTASRFRTIALWNKKARLLKRVDITNSTTTQWHE